MQINLISCLFVLDSEKNDNIRKNDIKKLKILVDKSGNLPSIANDGRHMRTKINEMLSNIVGTNLFHTQQVCAMSYEDSVDIVYVGAMNIENIKKLDDNYQLLDFKVKNNSIITLDKEVYNYKTVEIVENNNIIYKQIIDIKDDVLKRKIKNMLLSYKRIRVDIDTTDVIFKFMPKYFTLEDVRILERKLLSIVEKSKRSQMKKQVIDQVKSMNLFH